MGSPRPSWMSREERKRACPPSWNIPHLEADAGAGADFLAKIIASVWPASDRHDGHETIEEYLNSSRSFFPTNQGGVPKLINRDQILWVRAARSEGERLAYGLSEAHLILELVDGMRVEGNIETYRPAGQARISDILNSPQEIFACLRTDEDACFVNKRFNPSGDSAVDETGRTGPRQETGRAGPRQNGLRRGAVNRSALP
jgi:hypothetical protein